MAKKSKKKEDETKKVVECTAEPTLLCTSYRSASAQRNRPYCARFAADLKKSLPRIPIVEKLEDFMDFYQYGKKLADLHLNYEDVAPCPGVVVKGDRKATGAEEDYDYFHIWDKMRFKSKDDKSTIIYNGNITIENIPQKAYEYIVNGKSAIEWIECTAEPTLLCT